MRYLNYGFGLAALSLFSYCSARVWEDLITKPWYYGAGYILILIVIGAIGGAVGEKLNGL